ncbi:DUF4880 domain-containing protein [Alcaligenaceae bacterium SJ-26]|nr:DUF4880 domain-containing protein [Alcaligenaceae bacterium SJ-26]
MRKPPIFRRVRPDAAQIPPEVIAAAADWLVRLREAPSPADVEACTLWRQSHPHHELAWQRMAALGEQIHDRTASFGQLAGHALRHPQLGRPSRRQALKVLATGGLVGLVIWQGYVHPARRRWVADYRTRPGEQRRIALADGGELLLNTASAVDIRYSGDQRLVVLQAGEVMIRTAPDRQNRPFVLQTRAGAITPVGTRFIVRDMDARTPVIAVSVQEGAVELHPVDAPASHTRVEAGQQAQLTFDSVEMLDAPAAGADSWTRGMLVADQMPLGEFIAELGRYRSGVLRCQPELAHLPVTGAFPLADTDRTLAMLAEVLPIEIRRTTGWWVRVAAKT